jgi:hypothetical protein
MYVETWKVISKMITKTVVVVSGIGVMLNVSKVCRFFWSAEGEETHS